jgi:hypothetical protein
MTAPGFAQLFDELRALLQPYARNLLVKKDLPGAYSLDTPYSERWKRELFFGSVEMRKGYVSYHLMPVYMFPDLLDGLSDPLRRRMQGKSCFNFKQSDAALLDELAGLTRRGFERLQAEQLV